VSHGIERWELIVILVIESSHKLSKNQWLWGWAEILLQVEFGETLAANLKSGSFVSSQVCSIDKSITVNSLGFMDPKFNEIIWLFNSFLLGVEESLEDIGQMTNIELIMEILSSLSEVSLNFRVKCECGLDNWANFCRDGTLELAEMSIQIC